MQLSNMAEIDKEVVEFPACATLWQGNCIRWQHLIFLFMYIVQLYKEDWGVSRMLGCRTVTLPSTKQIVKFIHENQKAFQIKTRQNKRHYKPNKENEPKGGFTN